MPAVMRLWRCPSCWWDAAPAPPRQPPRPLRARHRQLLKTQTPRTLTFKVAGIHDSSHGTLQADIKATGYTMTATIEGLTPNSRYVIMIHAGTCTRVEDMYYVA